MKLFGSKQANQYPQAYAMPIPSAPPAPAQYYSGNNGYQYSHPPPSPVQTYPVHSYTQAMPPPPPSPQHHQYVPQAPPPQQHHHQYALQAPSTPYSPPASPYSQNHAQVQPTVVQGAYPQDQNNPYGAYSSAPQSPVNGYPQNYGAAPSYQQQKSQSEDVGNCCEVAGILSIFPALFCLAPCCLANACGGMD